MATYSIYIEGLSAINRARELCNGYCYTHIADGKGQMEVVGNDEWEAVAIAYIKQQDVDDVLCWLEQNGFGGMFASIKSEEISGYYGCYCWLTDVCTVELARR